MQLPVRLVWLLIFLFLYCRLVEMLSLCCCLPSPHTHSPPLIMLSIKCSCVTSCYRVDMRPILLIGDVIIQTGGVGASTSTSGRAQPHRRVCACVCVTSKWKENKQTNKTRSQTHHLLFIYLVFYNDADVSHSRGTSGTRGARSRTLRPPLCDYDEH